MRTWSILSKKPKILDRTNTYFKLVYKEMLYIRILKPSLNIQNVSDLLTLIFRNYQQKYYFTRDIKKYLKPKDTNTNRKKFFKLFNYLN